MNNYAIDKKLIKQLITIKKEKKPSEEVLNSLYAQAMIEHSIFLYQKEKLLQSINHSLDLKDKNEFMRLTETYNQFLEQYKQGKVLYEKGYKITLFFDT